MTQQRGAGHISLEVVDGRGQHVIKTVWQYAGCPHLMACGHVCVCHALEKETDPDRLAADRVHLRDQHHCAQGHLAYRYRPELKPW